MQNSFTQNPKIYYAKISFTVNIKFGNEKQKIKPILEM
jgi:hypothetical protein